MRLSQAGIVLLVSACSLFAAEKTQQLDFTSGGLLRMKNSTGALTIEVWDKPTVELTTTSSNPAVTITPDRQGNELTIATSIPKHTKNLDISYHLYVPRNTRLAIDHRDGEVNVEGTTADITATVRRGQIFLYLPSGIPYTTNAVAKLGSINLPGDPALKPEHLHLGHRLIQPTVANAHLLNLKVGFGDIYILNQTPTPTYSSKSKTY
jgi:hypothetical protein